MAPKSFKELMGSANEYEYRADAGTTNAHREETISKLHLVGKIDHEIFNVPQWLPPNIKVAVKLTPVPSNYILRKVNVQPPMKRFSHFRQYFI